MSVIIISNKGHAKVTTTTEKKTLKGKTESMRIQDCKIFSQSKEDPEALSPAKAEESDPYCVGLLPRQS